MPNARQRRNQYVLFLFALIIMRGRLSARAADVYYQTLRPQPVIPAVRTALCRGRRDAPRPSVMMADEPRQAALIALDKPTLGVQMAARALSAGIEQERVRSATSVDLYFEAVAFSWNFVRRQGATLEPAYRTAWNVYHAALRRLMAAGQKFGRLDASRGLQVMTPTGPILLPINYHGFVWKPIDFNLLNIDTGLVDGKLVNHYRCNGLGVPVVIERQHSEAERFHLPVTPFAATVVLRPSLAAMAGQASPLGAPDSHGSVEFYDPLRIAKVRVNRRDVELASDMSAPFEAMIRRRSYNAWDGLWLPDDPETKGQLFMLEPYQPGKYPIVFIHGFYSSSVIWADLANEIMASKQLRDRFQIWAYRYPTGAPFLESAAVLRRELSATISTFDPDHRDSAMSNMMLVGHGMGGLIAKLQVTSSGDTIWRAVANRPIGQLRTSDAQRQRLFDLFYFEPLPFVSRVAFMGTPHDGAMTAGNAIGQTASHCIQMSTQQIIEHRVLMNNNPGVFTPEVERRIPTSIDMLSPSSCLLQSLQGLCPGPELQMHNIIGTGLPSPLQGPADGIVAVDSARHPGVSTERLVHTSHQRLHDDPETFEEIKCVMVRHAWESPDRFVHWTQTERAVESPTILSESDTRRKVPSRRVSVIMQPDSPGVTSEQPAIRGLELLGPRR